MSQLMLSLFPGIGLLDMAFEEEGFVVVRGPDVLWGGDIRRFHPPAGKFDGVIGGPPCQSFSSLVHLVRANGHEPKFGNLIPEFERCVLAAAPDWFVMENVPKAPEPVIAGYGIRSFLLDNSGLAGEGGFGLEQKRVRRFTFGLRGREAPCLLRWVDMAVFLLPEATGSVTQWTPDNSQEAKRRSGPVTATHDSLENVTAWSKRREVAVTSTDGGVRPSEKKRVNAVLAASSQNEGCMGETAAKKQRRNAVSGSNGGRGAGNENGSGREAPGAGNGGKGRYKLPDACRLQGLPEDFLSDAPFTADGKLKAVANGVPLPMGRAIARAVKEAIGQ
jgi:site-specific DNA-cytosine methylase